MQNHDGGRTRYRRIGYLVAKQVGIALIAFASVKLIVANPPPASPEQLAPANEKLCSEALRMKCRIVQ